MKLSYEALHQRQEELTASCSTPPGDAGRAMSEWLRESQEATKELLKLKDHLIEVERNVSDLSVPGSKHGRSNVLICFSFADKITAFFLSSSSLL